MLRVFTRQGVRSLQQLRSGGRRCMSTVSDDEDDVVSVRSEKSVNQVNLLGRVGRDAEIRGSEQHPVCIFPLATNIVYNKPGGGVNTRTDWHRISVFKPGLREKVAANLKKGDRVFLSGMIRYDEYTDTNDNLVRTTTILANDLVNLTKRYLASEQGEEPEGF